MDPLSFAAGALLAAVIALVALTVFVQRSNNELRIFLKEQAIDERNQRMHTERELLGRIASTPQLTLDPSAPPLPEIAPQDAKPFISDFEMDDDQYEAYVKSMYPSANGEAGPAPVDGFDSAEDSS